MNNKWSSIKVCVECDRRISAFHIACGDSLCPHCGRKGRYLLPDTHDIVFSRVRKVSPIWRFWDVEYKYKTRDTKSEAWINKHILTLKKEN